MSRTRSASAGSQLRSRVRSVSITALPGASAPPTDPSAMVETLSQTLLEADPSASVSAQRLARSREHHPRPSPQEPPETSNPRLPKRTRPGFGSITDVPARNILPKPPTSGSPGHQRKHANRERAHRDDLRRHREEPSAGRR